MEANTAPVFSVTEHNSGKMQVNKATHTDT